jgi:cobalt-zinc-cadmium efflux system outer membrane protein
MRVITTQLCAAAIFCIPVVACAQNVGLPVPAVSTASDLFASSAPLTLEQAWQLGENANPLLRQAQAQRSAAEGELADASRLLWNNPRLSTDLVRRQVPQVGADTQAQREWSLGVEQTFEIGGQQTYRRQAAQLQQQALDASIEDARREMRGEVERRFVQVLSLQERIATERQSAKLVEDTAASVKKRVAAGEDTRLDGNVAIVEAARAGNQINLLEEQLIQARSDLAATLQLPGQALPAVVGVLDMPQPGYTLEALLARAATRAQLRALDAREQAARNRLSLERAARYPDITVGISSGREGATQARERLTSLTVSIPLPLFRQNGTAIGRASSDLTLAQIERQVAARNGAGNVTALWQKLQSLTVRVDALRKTVLPALEENQSLSVKSLQAGEIGLFQLLVVNRQVLDGQRDLIDAQTDLRLTRIALQLAAGIADGEARP